MSVLTTISEALRNLFREGRLTKITTKIQRSGMFVNIWVLEFSGVLWTSYMLVEEKSKKESP